MTFLIENDPAVIYGIATVCDAVAADTEMVHVPGLSVMEISRVTVAEVCPAPDVPGSAVVVSTSMNPLPVCSDAPTRNAAPVLVGYEDAWKFVTLYPVTITLRVHTYFTVTDADIEVDPT